MSALRCHVPLLALRLERMVALAEQVGRKFVAWRPLSSVRVEGAASQLVLSFVDATQGVKVEAGLGLSGLLDPRLNAGVWVTADGLRKAWRVRGCAFFSGNAGNACMFELNVDCMTASNFMGRHEVYMLQHAAHYEQMKMGQHGNMQNVQVCYVCTPSQMHRVEISV